MNKKKSKGKRTLTNGEPTFVYTSNCCEVAAKKPALVRTEEAQGTLGHWSCTKCGKSTKVKRSKPKKENAVGTEPETGTTTNGLRDSL